LDPSLATLIALQTLDSAADAARRRLAELPAAELALEAHVAAAVAAADAIKARLQENQHARRQLEKDVAVVDMRLARFDEHRAAIKTNHEYQALTHEIATAKSEKDAIEERILVTMEEADGLGRELKAAGAELATVKKDGDAQRAAFAAERRTLDQELARLAAERSPQASGADPRVLATYEQLLKGRRGVAVTPMVNGVCGACQMRLRPHAEQQVRRNDGLVQCESCQRILYHQHQPAQAT
jgi:hypothetical protein